MNNPIFSNIHKRSIKIMINKKCIRIYIYNKNEALINEEILYKK